MASSGLVSNPARGETEAWDKRVHHLLPLLYLNIAYIVYTVFASGRILFSSPLIFIVIFIFMFLIINLILRSNKLSFSFN